MNHNWSHHYKHHYNILIRYARKRIFTYHSEINVIGVFHIITHRMIHFPKLFINFRLQVHCAVAAFAFLTLCCFLKNDRYMIYKLTLLLMCMDVQPNPGPTPTDNSSLDILHLNTRSIRYKLEYLSDLSESYHVFQKLI